jgi:Fic family protein
MHESIHEAPPFDAIDRAIVEILQQEKSGCQARALLSSLTKRGHSISQPTLSRRLARLAAQRHVIARRAGRSTVYLRDAYHDWFSLPPTRRPKVSYNPKLLENYAPGETRWFSQQEIDRLHQAGGDRVLDASTYSRAIAQKLLVDLSFASSALEGNTYSYLDTEVLVEFGQAAEGKAAEETQMILNHKEAILYLIDNISDIDVSPRELRTLHALLSRGLIEPAAVGAVRSRPVDIGGSAYVPMAIPQKLSEEVENITAKAAAIREPFEQSLFLMAFVSYLQPFLDVNKRTGRLACNIPLLKNRLAPLSFLEMDKEKYVEGLLALYELNRIDLLRDAYIEGYVGSASRYDAYVARDRSALELEVRHRGDIHTCVKSYVESSVRQRERVRAHAYARECFSAEPPDLQSKLAERVAEIVAALNDANHIAYGISKKLFGEYQSLPTLEEPDEKMTGDFLGPGF